MAKILWAAAATPPDTDIDDLIFGTAEQRHSER